MNGLKNMKKHEFDDLNKYQMMKLIYYYVISMRCDRVAGYDFVSGYFNINQSTLRKYLDNFECDVEIKMSLQGHHNNPMN